MKGFILTLCLVTAVVAEEHFRFQANGGCVDACIGLENGRTRRATPLLLKTCNAEDTVWFLDFSQGQGSVRIRSKKDLKKCIQAGAEDQGIALDGMKLRVSACEDNRNQLFHKDSIVTEYSNGASDVFGELRLLDFPDLCVVYRGTNPDVGLDPIILKSCDDLDEMRAYGWEGDQAD
mmetsp:Transcript_5153/g.8479  ORF Transcript_5153/g.8479 Transcript_5153/m.8479 type:complete len:177 (+) Transcript_5153:170-700(+)|eukprot:CAMPEP_0119026888 /NCGR_PEP_ID=MMETSP1176-20130426/36212_1 /TAXON_ID=265551 /ORGANISM="Synedropsis recta cf, Strain CCMP1620" /LENGTH=176 /DNA_ID=CAMNT_0006982703 /DNA_START=140 /DNA_END=670 /DNA_ORIENTATION=-